MITPIVRTQAIYYKKRNKSRVKQEYKMQDSDLKHVEEMTRFDAMRILQGFYNMSEEEFRTHEERKEWEA